VTGPTRIPGGPAPTLGFTFDGVAMRARPGDTLAAALLANGVGLVGRSFKYHRPRGVMSAGVEEPNALVTVGTGGRTEPNTRATDVFVYDGLVARSQNRWPSLKVDVGAVLGLAAPVFAAGFYYKTFFGPPKRWMVYERFIRRAAGLGPAPTAADPDVYEHRAAFCDVLVVGSGPAGLAAASAAAAAAGERVLLIEQDAELGGTLRADGGDLAPIAAARAAILAGGGRVLTRTTASGVWDHGFITLSERVAEPGQPGPLAQRYWQVRAKRIVLATGAIERPLTFAGNDRPGVMLARAVRTYIRRFGVLPGRRVVVATNNDDAYKTADAVAAAGGEVVAILDSRATFSAVARAANKCHPVYLNATPRCAIGGGRCLTSVEVDCALGLLAFAADCLAVSGGFTPVVHLHSQGGGKLDWRDDIQAFVPGATLQNITTVGSAAGEVEPVVATTALLVHPKSSFIDFQNDVTAADVDLAWAEGYRSVEHLKRYTTLGMGTDQGKTSNMAALARLAGAGATTIPVAGLTTFRPPYTPLTLGALAGPDGGGHAAPARRLALGDAHDALAPIWQPLALWHRPRAYPRAGETLHAAALREARAVRTAAGIIDVSTLAKFIVAGPDAAALLEIVCATGVAKLAVGRGRYTFMLREDGMVMDDGTVWRLHAARYLLTSSTSGAERMEAHLGYAQRVLAPHLRASVVAVQEVFAGIALAGPHAAAILERLTGAAPPAHMGVAEAVVAGVPVLILAASYSGERAFELYPAGDAAAPVWEALLAAGAVPYGIEALELLRIEKGHIVVGGEADGRTTPHDLRLDRMLRKSGGFVGASALDRPALAAPDRLQLVGLTSPTPIPEGAMLVAATGSPVEGHVTAAGLRVLGGSSFGGGVALALLRGGRGRNGETLLATSPTRRTEARVTVTDPMFYDPEGARYRG
jgi:glycine cleavage system aminomethyltransferase T/NADPH-dependent 2,4-dienoyl-CoA reductase/sulfur reductase-like enzyme